MKLILPKEINGSESLFKKKILSKQKKHVITSNYSFRKGQIVDVIISSDEELQNEDPEVIASIPVVSTQTIKLDLENGILKIYIDGILTKVPHDVIFVNEGIKAEDFIAENFDSNYQSLNGILIHFTSLTY